MKRIILAVAALMVLSSPARAQPITGAGGLQRVIHDNTLTGEGTTPHPLSVVGAATYISGTLTSPKLVVATGAHTVGDFGGSDPGACPAGQADAHPALSASGTLTKSCSVFVNAAGAGLSLSGSSVSMPNTGPGVSTVTYATITTDVQGRVTASSSGAAPALASTTITAGNGLTGGGDLSANRTIDVGAGLGILSNANDVAIDPTYTQRRVTGTCSDPFGIITVAQDGTVTCSTTTVGSSVGTASTVPRYTAARTLGNGSMTDDGAATVSIPKVSSVAVHYVGDFPGNATDVKNGYEVTAYSDGNNYIDSKVQSTRSTIFRTGAGANSGATTTYETVTGSTGAVTWAAAQTMSSTLQVGGVTTLTNAGSVTRLDIKNTGTGGREWLIDSNDSSVGSGAASKLSIFDLTGGQYRFLVGSTSMVLNLTNTDTLTLHGATSIDSTLGVTGLSTLTGGYNSGAESIITAGAIGDRSTNGLHFAFSSNVGAISATQPGTANRALTIDGLTLGLDTLSGGAITLGGLSTVNDRLVVNGPTVPVLGTGNLIVNASATAQTIADARGIVANLTGSFNTAGGAATEYGVLSGVSGTRSGGASALTNIAFYGTASGAQTNFDFYGAAGTFYQSGTSQIDGATTINNTLAVNPAASATAGVTVTWSPTGSSSGAFYANMTPSANTSSVYTINAATAGTFNTTGGPLFSYGVLAQLSSTRSSGSNALTNIGIYSTATGAQANIALQTDAGDVKLATVSGAITLHGATTADSTLAVTGTSTLSGAVTINTTTAQAFTVTNTTQVSERMRLAGQEWYAASNTSTDGPALLLGLNRTNDRRIWVVDSAAETANGTNVALQFLVGSTNGAAIGGISTDGNSTKTLTLQPNGGSLVDGGSLAVTTGVTLNTSSGTTAITGHGATNFSIADASTAIAADIKNLSSSNTATLNTTAAVRASYGEFISVANSISSGSNTLTSIASYLDNTSSGANITEYVLYTDHGDVRLNATNGITGIKGPLTVDNTNSSHASTSSQINFTATAVVGDGYGEQVSQSGTFDLTAANRAAYGLKISNTAAKSAGNNSLSVFGLYVDTSGAGVTNVTSNQGVFSNGGDIAVASSATTTHELKVNGHENTGGTALVNGDLSACGTGTPTVGAGSTDMAGLITEGTTATGCTLTFKATYTVAPFCTCTGETSGSAAVLVGCSTTATTMVVANASATGDKIYYQCIGTRGGS